MMTLIAVSISCATTPAPAPTDVSIDLCFPKFPDFVDQNGNSIITKDGDTVSMPFWYFKKITAYKVLVDKAEAKYKVYKNNTEKSE